MSLNNPIEYIKKYFYFHGIMSIFLLVLSLGVFSFTYFKKSDQKTSPNTINITQPAGVVESEDGTMVKGEEDQQNQPSNYSNENSVLQKVEGAFLNNSPQFTFQNGILKIKNSVITSGKIKNHTIEADDIDGSSITSRTIKNNSIQGEDIDNDTDITIDNLSAVTISTSEAITTSTTNTTTLDFGTNTISDGELNGNWDFNGGDLTTTGKITANTINTGQGNYELYAMDQNVLSTSSPTFAGLTLTGTSGILKSTAGVISGSATTTDLTEGTNLYYTDERVDDRTSSLIQNGTGISWVYIDASGTLTPTVSLSPFTTSNLTEGTNLYYLDSRARTSISETITGVGYDNATGIFSLTTGYVIPTTTQESNWNTAYSNRVDTWNYPLSFSGNAASLNYNATNLKLTSNALNTIQDIASNSSPTFTNLFLTGNMGIGTTAPNSKLEVTGDIRITSGSGGQLIFADGSSMSSAGAGSAASVSSATDAIITGDSDANSSGGILLKTGSNTRLTITNDGNIGIGTTDPGSFKLNINGNTNITGDLTITGDDLFMNTNTSGYILIADGTNYNPTAISGDATLASTGVLTVSDDSHSHTTLTISGLDISDDTNLSATSGIVLTGDQLTHSTANGYIHLPSDGSSTQMLQYSSAGTAKWITFSADATIADNGAITVADDSHNHTGSTISGLSTADFTLATISQWTNDSTYITASSTHTGLIQSTTSGNSYFTGGNLGIGTTNPTVKLEVYDGATANLFRVSTGAIEAAYIDSSGLVGIGTTHPHSKLSVSGGMTIGSGYTAVMGDGNVAVEGNVGIGTTAPLSKLSINGGLHVGGDSDAGDNNLLVDGTATVNGAVITGGTNTFNLTNGTASLDVAAGAAVDVNANLTVESASTVNQDLTTDALPTFSGGLNTGASNKSGIRSISGSVANHGTLDLTLMSATNVINMGTLMVSSSNGDANYYSQKVYAFMSRGTTYTATEIGAKDGTGAIAFTLSMPSNGVLRVTNTTGYDDTSYITITFIGTYGY